MSDDRRKLNKHSTGTVPKVKHTVEYRNNTGQQFYSERDNLRNLPNNLSSEWPSRRTESNFQRNSQHMNFESMDTLEESHQNGIYTNGTTTSSLTSSSNSRRNSCGTVPKCDNIAKYPNKKQIEEKLNQIQEYLQITSSLMSNMKNTDDQNDDVIEKENLSSIIDALKDSEAKLNCLLAKVDDSENSECIVDNSSDRKNDFEDQTNREILREVQNMSLQHLKQKGDSRLRDARRLQERLAHGNSSNTNGLESVLQGYDLAIAELEETSKRLKGETKGDVNNFHQQGEESFTSDEIEELQNQIHVMHSANEDRTKLIQLLDKRDEELRCQHLELQNKLIELQSKKSQVDHLVAALQNPQRSEDDMGYNVRKIVSMKDQLLKLKDMLEMVTNTEAMMQNGTQEEQAIACEIYAKAENFLNKDLDKSNCSNQSHAENHQSLQHYENRAGPASVNLDNRGKQTNKNSRDADSGQCSESNTNMSKKLVLQAELKAKKRELEEIMGKHKASSSNLNHDVGTDSKSEFSCNNSIFDNVSGVWAPLLPSQHNQADSSERYSSDECTEDANDYRDVTVNRHQGQSATVAPSGARTIPGKYSSERNNSSDFLAAQAYERMCQQSLFRLPEENARGNVTEGNASFSRGSSVSNLGMTGKQNVQKQLELIRSVCDSMLPQQTDSSNQSNVQHLRNNLTPSPIYSELRPFASPNQSHPSNALNVVNHATPTEGAWFATQPNLPFSDVANYQNWLATNTLQTQAFMLNSLNQCCQMLWLQQRELANLRGMVTALQQERLPSPHYNNENQITSPMSQNLNCNPVEPLHPPVLNPCVPTINQCRSVNPKGNSALTPCSLSNLNQYNSAPVNVDFANHNNLRLMDAINNHEVRNVNMATLQGFVNNSDVRNVATLQGVVNNSDVRNVNMASLQGGVNNAEVRNVNMATLQSMVNNSDGRNVNMSPLQTVGNNSDIRNVNMSTLHMNNQDDRNINLASLPVSNDNMNQLPGHMWNGQALNNQVAPGNRANNYWDNFRSYSRQNLFSTKSNDGIQNSPLIDRTNNVTPRSIPFEVHSTPKSNSQQVIATPQESAPQRSCVKPSRRYTNTNIAVVPPDVLNIKNDGLPLPPIQNEVRATNEPDVSSPSHSVYSNSAPRTPRRHSNVLTPSMENLQNPRRRNVSNETANTEGNVKSKLFEELRENVYREVASLISANEARPHFLIQLFRDLQLVSSDPLRLKTLQSIQVLISQSLRNSQGSILQESSPPNQEMPTLSNEFSMQSTVWSPIQPNSVPRNATILEGLISKKGDSCQTQYTFHEIIPFLNENEHLTINQHLLATLKQKIVEAKSFKKAVKDTIFQKHFLNVLDDVLSFYNDKPMSAVKISLLQNIRDLLDRELSFMNLVQSAGDTQLNDLVSSNLPTGSNMIELRCQQVETGAAVQIQNEDLAEADQSHVEDDDIEEEGAVGGYIETNVGVDDTNIKEGGDVPATSETFTTSTEAESQYQLGLDQVPTRLPTKSKSPSTTPKRDRPQNHDDDQDHLN
ncbi:hypothetical protein WA026_009445 [Henosepilachna vigintioctopunctata]|uniref:Pericentriolar material 1 protein C-terminal domain-containing protein n=1 Tax=Henosepilachna vigintioctopunctata TaxID=420089 RepID=A0AAW1U4M5_9CUCU